MRFLTAGESHGKMLVAILEGMPEGITLDIDRINLQLKRRQYAEGRSERMKIEDDTVKIVAGVRDGVTTGAPIALIIENKDYENWADAMDTLNGDSAKKQINCPRPNHVDFAASVKYNTTDARNYADRASARNTAILTAVGAVCMEALNALNVRIGAAVVGMGEVEADSEFINADSIFGMAKHEFCPDKNAAEGMKKLLQKYRENGDTVGAKIVLFSSGVKCGTGGLTQLDTRLDYQLSCHLMGIQAVKSVSFGLGEQFSKKSGSFSTDNFNLKNKNKIENNLQKIIKNIERLSNNCGGIEGGIANGQDIIINLSVKPIPTIKAGAQSVNLTTGELETAHFERADVCAAPALCVVAECVAAFVLLDSILKRTGGDTFSEVKARWQGYP